MAERGAPIGNKNSTKGKEWRDALQRAMATRSKGAGWRVTLEKIADKVIELAEGGDLVAAKEIADRMDGKPHQAIQLEVERPLDGLSESELAAGISLLRSLIDAQGVAGGAESQSQPAKNH